MVARNRGFCCQAWSAKRLSPFFGATSDRPRAILTSSWPRPGTVRSTACGWCAATWPRKRRAPAASRRPRRSNGLPVPAAGSAACAFALAGALTGASLTGSLAAVLTGSLTGALAAVLTGSLTGALAAVLTGALAAVSGGGPWCPFWVSLVSGVPPRGVVMTTSQ